MPRAGGGRNGGPAAPPGGPEAAPLFPGARRRDHAEMARRKVLVLDVVGLTLDLLPRARNLKALAERGFAAPMDGVLPGVTCTAQATLLTGAPPREHGVVGNGWYF